MFLYREKHSGNKKIAAIVNQARERKSTHQPKNDSVFSWLVRPLSNPSGIVFTLGMMGLGGLSGHGLGKLLTLLNKTRYKLLPSQLFYVGLGLGGISGLNAYNNYLDWWNYRRDKNYRALSRATAEALNAHKAALTPKRGE